MKKSILMGLVFGLVAQSFAVSGVAVSTAKYKDASTSSNCRKNTPHMIALGSWGRQGNMDTPGKITRMIIKDDNVASHDTIYDGLSRYPTLSFDGTKVAFVRYEAYLSDPTTLVDDDKPCHIAVMNQDGGNVSDLATVPCKGDGANHISIDWPVGDWIYYQVTGTHKIRRVKYNDPSTDEFVFDYVDSFRKWDMSANGEYASIQYNEGAGNKNIPHPFPPVNGLHVDQWSNTGNCATIGCNNCAVGCNSLMSPAGDMIAHFSSAGHEFIRVNGWAEPIDCLSDLSVTVEEMTQWAGEEVGGGMDWPRWSANSNKWMCLMIGVGIAAHKYGGNQVLMNWKDKEAIKVTDNKLHMDKSVPAGELTRWNTAGDLWLEGMVGERNGQIVHCYEDSNGVLVDPLSGEALQATGSRANIAQANLGDVPSLRMSGEQLVLTIDASRVDVFDMQGSRLLSMATSSKSVVIPRNRIPAGAFVISAHTPGGVRNYRIVR